MHGSGAAGHGSFDNVSGGRLLGSLLPTSVSDGGGFIRRGIVAFHNPGIHGCIVQLDDGTSISCLPANTGSGSAYSIGATSSSVYLPGTPVAVLQYGRASATGVILCALDHQVYTDEEFHTAKSDEGAALDFSQENSYSLDSLKKNYRPCGSGMYKASDTYAGDWMLSNEFGAAFFLGRTRATVRGSNLSRIDFFPIDDVLRVTAGYLQEYTHAGRTDVFMDVDGYVSKELLFSPYAWETGGCRTKSEFEGKVKPPDDDDKEPEELENQDMARYREFQGSIAGGRQIFTSYPKNGKNIGLSHVALSDSGAVVVRSTSDIVFSTTRKIDVPVRVKRPEDPEGEEKPQIEAKDESGTEASWGITPNWWKHDLCRRTISNLVKNLYRRFRKNKKDWRIDSEAAQSDYDEHSKSKADIKQFAGTAQIMLGHDGSIVLSTSEGAEIRLHGENITISCPGALSFRAGQEISFISKKDIHVKAKEHAEILAKNNVTLAAGGRVAAFGGNSIFMEVGDSKEEDESFGKDNGSRSPGIYVKVAKDKGHVLFDSDTIYIHPRKQMYVASHDENGNVPRNSQVLFAVGQVFSSSNTFLVNTGKGEAVEAGLSISSDQAMLFGRSAGVAASSTPAICGGGKMPMFIDADRNIYDDLVDGLGRFRSQTMFTKIDAFDNIPRFSFYYADTVILEESPWPNFQKSEPAWGDDLKVNETMPWPGKDVFCRKFKADYSKLKDNDDDFGDKKEPVAKPEETTTEFKEFRG